MALQPLEAISFFFNSHAFCATRSGRVGTDRQIGLFGLARPTHQLPATWPGPVRLLKLKLPAGAPSSRPAVSLPPPPAKSPRDSLTGPGWPRSGRRVGSGLAFPGWWLWWPNHSPSAPGRTGSVLQPGDSSPGRGPAR